MILEKAAGDLGLVTCLEFDIALIKPEKRIRALCREDKCDSYGKNYTCPPYAGSLGEIRARLKEFKHGWLLQYSKQIEVKNNKEAVIQSKLDFHNKVLMMEDRLKESGASRIWGMIGGNCGLCIPCKARSNEPCLYPDKARMSLEAVAVDVMALLDKLGLDSQFHENKITWTGCILC
jgi:predicted metal-binding protein